MRAVLRYTPKRDTPKSLVVDQQLPRSRIKRDSGDSARLKHLHAT
jgi:hypothetical protein